MALFGNAFAFSAGVYDALFSTEDDTDDENKDTEGDEAWLVLVLLKLAT